MVSGQAAVFFRYGRKIVLLVKICLQKYDFLSDFLFFLFLKPLKQ